MKRRIIAIGGEPATGKSSIMLGLMSMIGLQGFTEFNFGGLLRGHYHMERRVLVLGVYEAGSTFSGTDRLSMAVMPVARGFLERLGKDPEFFPGWTILFEGDRLFNIPFLEHAAQVADLHAFVLTTSDAEKERRHKFRGDTQKPTWLKGRKTKVVNIVSTFPGITLLDNSDEAAGSDNLNLLHEKIFPPQ